MEFVPSHRAPHPKGLKIPPKAISLCLSKDAFGVPAQHRQRSCERCVGIGETTPTPGFGGGGAPAGARRGSCSSSMAAHSAARARGSAAPRPAGRGMGGRRGACGGGRPGTRPQRIPAAVLTHGRPPPPKGGCPTWAGWGPPPPCREV